MTWERVTSQGKLVYWRLPLERGWIAVKRTRSRPAWGWAAYNKPLNVIAWGRAGTSTKAKSDAEAWLKRHSHLARLDAQRAIRQTFEGR